MNDILPGNGGEEYHHLPANITRRDQLMRKAAWSGTRARPAFLIMLLLSLLLAACGDNTVPPATPGLIPGSPTPVLTVGATVQVTTSAATTAVTTVAPTTTIAPVTTVPATTIAAEPTSSGIAPTVLPSTGPKAYVGVFKDNNVTVIDTMTNKVLGVIPIPAGPHSLVITPDGRKLFASSDGASTVSVIDTTTDKVVSSIEVGTMPHGLAMTPDSRMLLVAVFGTNKVAFIDTSTYAVVSQVPVGSPHNIGISPDGKLAYVASQVQGNAALVILDISTKTQIGTVPLDKVPRALNFSPDGKEVYFTQAGIDAVEVLNPLTNQVTTQIKVGASPHHPLFTSNGEYALVVDQGPGELAIIDPAKNILTNVVPVGKNPHWIASSSDGDTAWVTNEGSNDVTVVDVEHAKAIATIKVGNAPRKIVVQPGQAHNMAMAGTPGLAANTTAPAAQPTDGATAAKAANGDGDKVSVSIKGFAFNPVSITIKPGQTVSWTNNDSVPHTVTSKDGKWDSGDIQPGATFSRTFEQEGTYAYYCSIHPSMLGELSVKS